MYSSQCEFVFRKILALNCDYFRIKLLIFVAEMERVSCEARTEFLHIVTCIPIARQQLGKHISAGANALNNRTSIARQRIGKHAFLTI
jgi:hypothetical protein